MSDSGEPPASRASAASASPSIPARIVSDVDQLRTAFSYQLRFYLRTWRFVGILIFVAVISAILLAVDVYRGSAYITTQYATASDFLANYLSYTSDAVVIAAAFLGGDALAMDLGGGPGYLMLTLPVRRYTLLAGRYSAAAVVAFAVILVYYAFATGASFTFYQSVPGALALSLAYAFLFGLAALAVAFFFSSFFKTSATAITATVLILILVFPILTGIGDLTGSEPWYSLDYASAIISQVLSSSFQHELITHLGGGKRGISITLYAWSPYQWEGIVIMLAYLVVFLALSYLVYMRKEVKG